ncbi:MAG: DUF4410 domain-containing protein [Desulfovibrionaceae bacterium]
MKKVILTLFVAVLLSACGTRRHDINLTNGEHQLPTTAKYCVAHTEDQSEYVFEEDQEKIDIAESMTEALETSLKEKGLLEDDCSKAYTLQPTVYQYSPGSAFKRWIFPGFGSTELSVSSKIYTAEAREVGTVETETSVDAGGGFTVGAWKYIFKQASDDLVKELQTTMGLIPKEQ